MDVTESAVVSLPGQHVPCSPDPQVLLDWQIPLKDSKNLCRGLF